MIRDPKERGSRRPAVRRNGVGGFDGWGGMVLTGDPASIPANRIRHGENVRFVGGNLKPRPGVEAFNSVAIHATDARILSLVDFQVAPTKLYLSLDGCPGISSSVGSSINWFDTEQEDEFSTGLYYSSATNNPVIGTFDGRVFIGVDSVLKAFTLIQADYGTEGIDVSGVEQAEVIWTFSGMTITFLKEFDGKLFIGLNNGAGGGQVAVWDGLTLFTDDGTGAISVPSAATVWREQLAMAFIDEDLMFRPVGDSPATWSTVVAAAMPAVGSGLTSYRDALYWVGGGTSIFKYDGSAVTTPKTIASAEIVSIAPAFGFLYYGWKTGANVATLGQMNSSGTFTDSHKTFTAEVATARYPRTLKLYRGKLAVGLNTSASGARLLLSPGSTTSGTYTIENPNSGDISQMIAA